jgi:hypothetical protein
LTTSQRGFRILTVLISLFVWTRLGEAQAADLDQGQISGLEMPASESALPDAPQPEGQTQSGPLSASQSLTAQQNAQPGVPRKYAQMIEPGQTGQPLSAPDKFIFSLLEASRAITILPSLYSAGYAQITGTDPKYGNDSGAFAAKFGAAMAHSASSRIFANGVLAPAFHQDPRYYRVAHGSFMRRTLGAAKQAVVRRADSGEEEFNYSGILGRGASAALVLSYYPKKSQTTRVVMITWGYSMMTDAGGNWVLEFLPDIERKLPFLKVFHVE